MSYFISQKQRRFELWGVAVLGFVLGASIGAFLTVSYVDAFLREAVR